MLAHCESGVQPVLGAEGRVQPALECIDAGIEAVRTPGRVRHAQLHVAALGVHAVLEDGADDAVVETEGRDAGRHGHVEWVGLAAE